jgi:hypothetical protein
MRGSALRVSTAIVLVVIFLGGADYWFKQRFVSTTEETTQTEEPSTIPQVVNTVAASSSAPSSIATAGTGQQLVTTTHVVKKGVSLKKQSGPVVETILSSLQLIPTETKEASLIQLTSPKETSVHTVVLLTNNDRVALFSWLESDDVKTLFSALKQSLQEQFSPQVTELMDETRTQQNGPPFDILSFLDPSISSEKVIFLRVRTRLYEFHIAKEKEEMIQGLMEALSK